MLPWVISGAVHLLVLLWWMSLPAPEPTSSQGELELRAVELVELEVTAAPSASPSDPIEEPRPPPEPQEPEVPPSIAPPRVGPAAPARPSNAGAEAVEPAPGEGPEDAPQKPGTGVDLIGLRGQSRATSRGPVPPPSLPPPRVKRGRIERQIGAARVVVPPARDGKPRSLAEAGFRRRRNGKLVYPGAGFRAELKPDGRMVFRDLPAALPRDPETNRRKVALPSMAGLAEGIRAAQGQELYQQQKKRLLEQTFELRLQMAVEFARDKVERRLASLYRELLDDWHDRGRSAAVRRTRLFERWDECEEGPAVALPGFAGEARSEVDEIRRSAGGKARETIEGFIRRHLAQGTADAFTAEELRRLNARRRSRARFRPYR